MLTVSSEVLQAQIDPLGATLHALLLNDDAQPLNVVAYGPDMRYGGNTIGRYANRIAGAQFEIDGTRFDLDANEGPNTLHGGSRGFDAAVWGVADASSTRVTFAHTSPHGDQGFPGTMDVRVTYAIADGDLSIAYSARSDRDTVVNLTNHTYFNLAGAAEPSNDQVLTIFADAYTPVDAALIPTGAIEAVEGTPYDFRTARVVARDTYDMNWVLRGDGMRRAATLFSPTSEWQLDILTTEPGLQVYSGNPKGLALETQHFPDSPHHAQFPTTLLRAGETFDSLTIYRFAKT